jgi:hypothetical protein
MNSSAGLPNVVRELDKGTIFRRTLLRTFERADRDIAVSRVKSQEHVRQSSIEKSQWAMDLLARAPQPGAASQLPYQQIQDREAL